jgi:hypothetical protein
VRAGYRQNGRSVTLHPGDRLIVTLPSTNWSFHRSSNPRVLGLIGPVRVVRTLFNRATCPYGGCGTVTARFRAVWPGIAQVSASRTSCGEAMGCTGAAAIYRLTAVVTDAR